MPSQNRLSLRQEKALLLSLMLLMVQLTAPDWQASGNMTDYLPTIRGFMDAAIEDDLDHTAIAINISDSCNAAWDEFWNVYVVWLRDSSSDMVVYGYAFRSHWYWHNNYSPAKQSFAIWKDYNCGTPHQYSVIPTGSTSGVLSVQNAIQAAYDADPNVVNDVWKWAQDVVDNYYLTFLANAFNKPPSEIGLSGIFVNEIPAKVSSRFCLSSSSHYLRMTTSPAPLLAHLFMIRFD